MAVGANTYGTIAKVQALVGDIVASRTFGASTNPTLVQAESFLDDIASEINMELEQSGYTVPVAVGTSPVAHAYLVAINTYGACMLVLRSMPAESYSGVGEEQPAQGRAQLFQQYYERGLRRIREYELPAARTTGLAERFLAGSLTDRGTGNIKRAIFTRSMGDYPGSRTLKDSS